MNLNKPFFVKSLETSLATQRLNDGKKEPFQSVEEIVNEGEIRPNTLSFQQDPRLSCTILNDNYTETYRPQGIIFQTDNEPDYIAPFDLMALANVPGEQIQADYYKIVGELKDHYGRHLISGYENFLFHTAKNLFETFPNPEEAWLKVNLFRREKGLSEIPESGKKLFTYNEAVFHSPIKITPIGLFGLPEDVPELIKRAKNLNLPIYSSVAEFFLKIQELIKEQKREQILR